MRLKLSKNTLDYINNNENKPSINEIKEEKNEFICFICMEGNHKKVLYRNKCCACKSICFHENCIDEYIKHMGDKCPQCKDKLDKKHIKSRFYKSTTMCGKEELPWYSLQK